MQFAILGNSIVRGVRVTGVTTYSINGLDWEGSVKYMISHRADFFNKIVFVVVGPLRFTTLHKSRNEVVFKDTKLASISQIFTPFYKELVWLRIRVIICPTFPMDFRVYNSLKCEHPIMTAFHDKWNSTICGHVVVENRAIYQFNRNNGFKTPLIHTRLYHRRHGKYYLRLNFLRDGLHVTDKIIEDWNVEFSRRIAELM